MPRIEEYGLSRDGTPNVVQGRRAAAEDFGDGRGLQQFGEGLSNIAGAINKRAAQSEISDTNAKLSQFQADTTTKWREALDSSEPGDPTLVQEFNKHVDDELNKIGDGIQTRDAKMHFEGQSASLRAHFMESAAAGQAELAGVKAKQDYLKGLSNYSSALTNDPSSLKMTLQMHDDGLNALVESGMIPSRVAVQLQNQGRAELTKASIRGWIDLNPQDVKERLKSGEWNDLIDGDQKRQLDAEADQEIRGREIEKAQIEKKKEEFVKKQREVTQGDFLAKMSRGELKTQDILKSNLEAFGSGSKNQFLNMLQEDSKRTSEVVTNPRVMQNLFDKIHLPDEDPNKIWDENDLLKYKPQLSWADLNHLRDEMVGKKTEAGAIESELKKGVMNEAKNALTRSNPMTGFKDPVGDKQMQSFRSFFFTEYKEQRKKGKTAAELLTPGSKDYIGNSIRNYVRSNDQIMKDMIGSFNQEALPVNENSDQYPSAPNPNGGGSGNIPPGAKSVDAQPKVKVGPKVLPRLPGETPAQWKKRKEGSN